jgi:hypothetical protein
MAIKKLTFSFDVPITAFLGLIATGNSGLKIDVVGDDKVHPLARALNGHNGVKLLEGPKHGNSGQTGPRARGKDAHGHTKTAYVAILETLARAPDYTATVRELRPIVQKLGLADNTAASQVALMRTRGHAKRIGEGTFQLTKPGIAECERRGIAVIGQSRKAKAKRPPKPKTPAPAAPVAAEQNNG